MPASKKRKKSPEQIIAGAQRPERDVTVCLRGDIIAEIVGLDDALSALAQASANDTRLASGISPEVKELAERIHTLELEADEESIELRVRALPRSEWRAAKALHPANEEDSALGWAIDRDAVAEEVLVESVVKPELDPDALVSTCADLAEGQWSRIVEAILTVNGGDGSIPFSQLGSRIRLLSSNEAESPEHTASASSASTGGNPAPSPRSRSGKTDARLGG